MNFTFLKIDHVYNQGIQDPSISMYSEDVLTDESVR